MAYLTYLGNDSSDFELEHNHNINQDTLTVMVMDTLLFLLMILKMFIKK